MAIVLSGGQIVTALETYEADVRIEDEKIVALGKNIRQAQDKVLDVDGCFLFPGGIDPHTHFDLPSAGTVTADDFASGTKAALLGGTTTIIDFATQFKGESLHQGLANWHAKAQGKSYADYGFHMAITDWNDAVAQEMQKLVQEEGVSSFKFYMAYKGSLQVDDGVLLQAFRESKRSGALLCLHCENGDIIAELVKEAHDEGKLETSFHPHTRPILAEREATSRAIALAELAQAPVYIVHLTSGEALQVVTQAKRRGLNVYAETCPQYLLLDESVYDLPEFEGAKYVISPPLRAKENQDALWQGIKDHWIETVATDHCSFNFQGQKELGREDFSKIPNGMPGVETRLALLYTYGVVPGKISLQEFVNLTSTHAAQLFGLYPRKGVIAVGSDADIVVWDPGIRAVISAQTQAQQVDYSPYEGFTQIGQARHVFLRGQHVVSEGQMNSEYPQGKYLYRDAFST
ncbi:dihydropyrimidinase [Desulfitobacterium sp.]|uniref:dihydropyrimidinase n=1 Tax=Desulfitobacterium sp. TaxID=49981 RepID=UPI002CB2B4F8|nr:dihydropyrimidinase [Desulfitobacterium sp.]HVJ50247.1 dihydropyrimidinase [Desulfitobacterium sp.]